MTKEKIDYRKKCLDLLGLPEGTVDSAILSALQAQMADWHPDKQKFTDYEMRRQAEEYFKTLNGLRQGLKSQKEQEKINNGIVQYSDDEVKEESSFSSIYEALDLKVKLLDAQEEIQRLEDANKRFETESLRLKEQLKCKNASEFKEKVDDIKHLYQPKKSIKVAGWSALAAVLIYQCKLVKDLLQEILGVGEFWVNIVLIILTLILLFINIYKNIQVSYVEEVIGFFTNPCNIGNVDKGKIITTKYDEKLHIMEESDFYYAIDAYMQKSRLAKYLFIGKKESIRHQIVDAVITDLLNKQIMSAFCVFNGNRTFKINDYNGVVRMDEGVL